MNIKTIPIFKQDERGIIYNCDKLNLIVRKKNSVSASHSHNDLEIFYLIEGTIQLTIEKETKIITAPLKIEIKPNQYHKIIATTDIILLDDRESERNQARLKNK